MEGCVIGRTLQPRCLDDEEQYDMRTFVSLCTGENAMDSKARQVRGCGAAW
jgi:hypothetical protein